MNNIEQQKKNEQYLDKVVNCYAPCGYYGTAEEIRKSINTTLYQNIEKRLENGSIGEVFDYAMSEPTMMFTCLAITDGQAVVQGNSVIQGLSELVVWYLNNHNDVAPHEWTKKKEA